MPQVILVRLTPLKPTSGAGFSSYLTNLSISAFDLSFGNSPTGVPVGQAQGAWIPNAGLGASGPAFTPATQKIVQHFTPYAVQVLPLPNPPDTDVRLEAVATAIITLTPPAAEFNTTDLRLEIRQNGQLVAYERLDFNVKVENYLALSGPPRPTSASIRRPWWWRCRTPRWRSARRRRTWSFRPTGARRSSCPCATPSTRCWRRIRAAAPRWPTAAR